MTQTVAATAQLGPGKTGLAIGLRVLNMDGTEYSAFSVTGVAETSVLGTYRKANGVVVPDAGGTIVWGVSGTDYVESPVDPAPPTAAAIAAAVIAGGSGTYSYSNTVDDGSGNLLDGVFVQCATDTGFTNIVSTATTNSVGAFTVYSDTAGTHYLRLQFSGITFAIQTVTLA